jgi:hypothetical protein
MKTNELIGPALDWAVAKCLGYNPELEPFEHWQDREGKYSADGRQGSKIIEREKIGVWPSEKEDHEGQWGARMLNTYISYGPTPLIAAMRCYVASKLGDEVEIPEELL